MTEPRAHSFLARASRVWVLVLFLALTGCGGGQPVFTPMLNTPQAETAPALSGDGRLVAYVADRPGRQELILYDLEAKQRLPLSGVLPDGAIAESPSLSRTGRYLVFVSLDQGRSELMIHDRATGRTERLLSGWNAVVRSPSISPDGRYVAFQSSRRGQWDIELYDRGDRTELDLPQGNPEASPPVNP